MTIAYLGLGSNLDNPTDQVLAAVEAIHEFPQSVVLATSSLYRNPPMGPEDQPDYVNAVVALDTQLDAHALFMQMKATERAQGRQPQGVRWGPRIIDLDLLLFGEQTIYTDELRVPHPGIAARAFVLVPLVEIAPQIEIASLGSAAQLLRQVDVASVVAIGSDR